MYRGAKLPDGMTKPAMKALIAEKEAEADRKQVAVRFVADAAARGLLARHDREQKAVFQLVVTGYIEQGFCSYDTDWLAMRTNLTPARCSRALTLFSDQGLVTLHPNPPVPFVRLAMGPWFADEAEEVSLSRSPKPEPLYTYEPWAPLRQDGPNMGRLVSYTAHIRFGRVNPLSTCSWPSTVHSWLSLHLARSFRAKWSRGYRGADGSPAFLPRVSLARAYIRARVHARVFLD